VSSIVIGKGHADTFHNVLVINDKLTVSLTARRTELGIALSYILVC
jgi:hypothetical protein